MPDKDLSAAKKCSHQLDPVDEKRLAKLFAKLDTNKDGKIDIHDLSSAFRHHKIPHIPGQTEKLFEKYDSNQVGNVDYEDFVCYVTEHEKVLRLSFESLDHNKDGFIDVDEMIEAFREMGVYLEHKEALQMIKRMDKDDTLLINWEEWREYLLFHPFTSMHDLVHYWRHASIDIGEPATVPDDLTEAELRSGIWWRHLVAGAVAGAVSRTCTAPLDRLKLMFMVYASQTNRFGIASGFRNMLREGGIWSLWRGNGINVLKIAPESALKFMAYEQVKRFLKTGSRELGIKERFAAGSMAGLFSQSAIYPLEVLKTRLALRNTGEYSGIVDCAQKLYRKEGPRCFFKGFHTNVMGIIPYAGIDLAVYETLKRMYISRHTSGGDPSVLVVLGCGSVSSTCGQIASYPLALIRVKQQANVSINGSPGTIRDHLRHILKIDGPRGLYRGLTPNILKVAPAVSISYVMYEETRRLLGVGMT